MTLWVIISQAEEWPHVSRGVFASIQSSPPKYSPRLYQLILSCPCFISVAPQSEKSLCTMRTINAFSHRLVMQGEEQCSNSESSAMR